MNLKDMQREAHDNAVERGFWENERNTGELLALIHSEVSEALEEYRNGRMKVASRPIGDISKPEGFVTELADIIIRVADLAEAYGYDLDVAVGEKMAYNRTRPYRHGGNLA